MKWSSPKFHTPARVTDVAIEMMIYTNSCWVITGILCLLFLHTCVSTSSTSLSSAEWMPAVQHNISEPSFSPLLSNALCIFNTTLYSTLKKKPNPGAGCFASFAISLQLMFPTVTGSTQWSWYYTHTGPVGSRAADYVELLMTWLVSLLSL